MISRCSFPGQSRCCDESLYHSYRNSVIFKAIAWGTIKLSTMLEVPPSLCVGLLFWSHRVTGSCNSITIEYILLFDELYVAVKFTHFTKQFSWCRCEHSKFRFPKWTSELSGFAWAAHQSEQVSTQASALVFPLDQKLCARANSKNVDHQIFAHLHQGCGVGSLYHRIQLWLRVIYLLRLDFQYFRHRIQTPTFL